jgi:hypothetical protein
MTKINTRSPYFIYHTDTNLTSAVLELYVYEGEQTTDRGSIVYTLDNLAISEGVTFEISELVRDYISITFDGTYNSQVVWVDYQITPYISEVAQTPETIVALVAFDGYGYFEDGAQNQSTDINDQLVLQSNRCIYKLADNSVRVAVDANSTYDVTYMSNNNVVKTESITASNQSASRIVYISDYFDNGIDNYEQRVLADGGTFESSICLKILFLLEEIADVDSLIINAIEYKIETIEECKYDPYKLTFVNKFGALQDLYFFKKSELSISTSKKNYNSNTISQGSYSISSHRNKVLSKNGSETLKLNSGFVKEEYNEVFRQFMLSENVWIEVNNVTLPVNVKDSTLTFKTSLNDKLISYSIDVEYAFDKINNVR